MPLSPDDARVLETVRAYRDALADVERLYRDAARLVVDQYSWLIPGEPNEFIAQMETFHRGLAMKIFGELAPAGPMNSLQHRQIGRVLLGHIWNQSVMGPELRDAVQWLIQESAQFDWEALVQPFAALPPLRDRWGELLSAIMRMANLVAKSDGEIGAEETLKLQQMQTSLELIRSGAPERFSMNADAQRLVVKQIARDAETLNEHESKSNRWTRAITEALQGTSEQEPIGAGSPFNQPNPERPPSTQATQKQANQTKQTTAAPAPNVPEKSPEERLREALQKLDELIGLTTIKEQVKTLTNFLKLEKLRQQEGLPGTKLALHMAFVGNPGTGKTTVARIIADIFGALGILTKGQLVETDRSGLVAEYAGQTGPKTNAKIDEAIDGVLFIDEAYTLVSSDSQDQYGREAVQTLLKRMEDARDRLIVVLAGYPLEMQLMIRSNPGLSSRVGQTFDFPDYTPGEMGRIFGLMCQKAQYRLPNAARRRVLQGFNYLYARRDRHFGNGRSVRNAFEASVRRLANRLAGIATVTRELLTTLEPEDIEIPGVLPAHLTALCAHTIELRVPCEQCHADQQIGDDQLDTKVECSACKASFVPAWGEPIPPAEPVQPHDAG